MKVRGHRTALERSEELARIEAALAEARTGRGTFVVIEGPAGIGKTALPAAARTAAADGGMRVLGRGEPSWNASSLEWCGSFEPPLADASEVERADLLEGAAGVAAGLSGFRGPPVRTARPCRPSISRSRPSTASTGCARTRRRRSALPDGRRRALGRRRVAALPGLPAHAPRRAGRRAVVATRPREAGTDAELFATVTSDPSADVIRLPADESSRRPACRGEARRGSRYGLRRRPPACDAGDVLDARARRGAERRRYRSDRGGSAPRRTNRGTNGRSLDSSGSVGCPSMRGGSLGRWRSSSRATYSKRRDSLASKRSRQLRQPSC